MHYEVGWMNDPFVKEIVKVIDKSEVIQDNLILDYQGRAMGPQGLSTSCKTLILLYKEDNIIVAGERMGDNCYEDMIFRVAEKKDIYVTLTFMPRFPKKLKFYSMDYQELVTTKDRAWDIYFDLCLNEDHEEDELTPEEEARYMDIIHEASEKVIAEMEAEGYVIPAWLKG